MEFKGTKGKWKVLYDRVTTLEEGITICKIEQYNEEDEADALLISKAPEMLEMLKETKEVIKWYMENSKSELSEPFFNIGANQIEQIEQLIKQATEL